MPYLSAQEDKRFQDYLRKGSWRCLRSPSGAHYWLGDETGRILTCRYCALTKEAPRLPIQLLERARERGEKNG